MADQIKHALLVGDVRYLVDGGFDLHMSCTDCGHLQLWQSDWLLSRLGGDFRLSEWSARYRCPGCGQVGISMLRMSVRANVGRGDYPNWDGGPHASCKR